MCFFLFEENLWLNLSDGKIFCGRQQAGGLKGNGHALMHYEKTKYPLAVKLGSLSAATADVYSYPEDDMVEDSKLVQHLSVIGRCFYFGPLYFDRIVHI